MRMTVEDLEKKTEDTLAPEAEKNKQSQEPETNSIRDEIKLQQTKMKDRPFTEKIKYFWKYYWIQTIVVIVVLLFVGNLIKTFTSVKPYAFQCFVINSFGLDSSEISDAFAQYEGIDTKTYDCMINTSYSLQPKLTDTYALATNQAIEAQIQNNALDAMMVDTACIYEYALKSYLVDLRTVFTPEEIEKYEPYFYYIDMADYDKAVENADEFGIDLSKVTTLSSAEEKNEEGLTHMDPSTMTDPVPVGIFVNDSCFVSDTQCYSGTVAVIGILANSQHIDTTIDFINYIWDENIKWESVY